MVLFGFEASGHQVFECLLDGLFSGYDIANCPGYGHFDIVLPCKGADAGACGDTFNDTLRRRQSLEGTHAATDPLTE